MPAPEANLNPFDHDSLNPLEVRGQYALDLSDFFWCKFCSYQNPIWGIDDTPCRRCGAKQDSEQSPLKLDSEHLGLRVNVRDKKAYLICHGCGDSILVRWGENTVCYICDLVLRQPVR